MSKYPYHEHVLRITLLFYVLLASKLIGTRSTNRIDLEYLLYLPFCQVFASGDKMHREIFDALKIKNCVYLERDELRNDLIEIDKYFDSFETKDLKYYKKTFGSYPPPIPDSPICSIWERFVGERRILKNKIHQPDMKVI